MKTIELIIFYKSQKFCISVASLLNYIVKPFKTSQLTFNKVMNKTAPLNVKVAYFHIQFF